MTSGQFLTLRILIIAYKFFSCNSEIIPVEQAMIPLNNVEYSYGFGVYETIRVSKGKILFVKEHCERLMESARIINLEHRLTSEQVTADIQDLVDKNEVQSCNIKILLIGAPDPSDAKLYILCLNPLFPDRKLYKNGTKTITQHYERPFPHAKTLNMLQSYLAYREAKKAGAYDALAINQRGAITEGTRTNFFAIKDKQIFSPPENDILLGVTRDHVLKIAKQNGFDIVHKQITPNDLGYFDGFFLTSTSSKIIPLTQIDDQTFEIPAELKQLMLRFDEFLAKLSQN